MRKFKTLVFLCVLLCTLFIININNNVNAQDNYTKIIYDNVTYVQLETGSSTYLYEVTVTFTTLYDLYDLKDDVILYFKQNVGYNISSPINRSRNSYEVVSLENLGSNEWELIYKIALNNAIRSSYNVNEIVSNLIDIYVFFEIKSLPLFDYLRDFFYRVVPDKRPENLYTIGMNYSSGSAYAGRIYWKLQDYIDISQYINEYNLFLSYTTVKNVDLYALYFYDENKNLIAWTTRGRFGDIYKFENEDRYILSMLNFKDVDTENYIDFTNVKFMQFEYLTEPYPDSSVLINLTNSIDISIGEYWRAAEAFNTYFQAGFDEGMKVGFVKGQDLRSDEIIQMLQEEYQRGYNKGQSDQLHVFSYLEALFGDQGLGRLLAIEPLPGVTIGAVLMIPIMFFLVSFIWRWFS